MSKTYDNNGQYSKHSILRYEKIFGEGFVSSGGLKIVSWLCERLNLQPGAKVLDIGCGIGGTAFYMAETFGAHVLGVDLAEHMIEIAKERAKEKVLPEVSFQLHDIFELEFPEGHFDLIWSRDALLHVADKPALFARIRPWLKPGGQLMISDYAQSAGPHSEAFDAYVRDSGYHLLDVESYRKVIEDAGFPGTQAEDWTPRFVEVLLDEMKQLTEERERFLNTFSEEDLTYLLTRWERKVGFCRDGDMKVGVWHCVLG